MKYSEIEPYYLKAEKTLRVRGGKLSKHMPPYRGFADSTSPDITPLKMLLASAGIVVDDSPTATPTKGLRKQYLALRIPKG